MYQTFCSSLIFVFDDLLHDAYGRKEARMIGCIRFFVLVFHEYASCFGKKRKEREVSTTEEF